MMPLLRQNILNRKASYADADLVLKYYEQHRATLHEIEQLRHKRNQHAQNAKSLVTIDDDEKREEALE